MCVCVLEAVFRAVSLLACVPFMVGRECRRGERARAIARQNGKGVPVWSSDAASSCLFRWAPASQLASWLESARVSPQLQTRASRANATATLNQVARRLAGFDRDREPSCWIDTKFVAASERARALVCLCSRRETSLRGSNRGCSPFKANKGPGETLHRRGRYA